LIHHLVIIESKNLIHQLVIIAFFPLLPTGQLMSKVLPSWKCSTSYS